MVKIALLISFNFYHACDFLLDISKPWLQSMNLKDNLFLLCWDVRQARNKFKQDNYPQRKLHRIFYVFIFYFWGFKNRWELLKNIFKSLKAQPSWVSMPKHLPSQVLSSQCQTLLFGPFSSFFCVWVLKKFFIKKSPFVDPQFISNDFLIEFCLRKTWFEMEFIFDPTVSWIQE